MLRQLSKRGFQKYCFGHVYQIRHQKIFELEFRFRQCSTLQQISAFILANEQQLREYGEPTLLEYLNELPKMFNYRCYKETPFESLLIPLSFPYKDIYCEQMKYSLMYYVLQCTSVDQKYLITWLDNHLDYNYQLMQKTNFDLVSAFNWVAQLRHSNHPIFKITLIFIDERFKDGFTTTKLRFNLIKPISIIIRRIINIGWGNFRHLRNILRFICIDLSLFKSNIAQKQTCFSLFTEVKLHLLSYRIVPLFVEECFKQVKEKINKFPFSGLEDTFKSFDYLPMNYQQHFFNNLYQHMLINIPRHKLNPLNLPFQRLSSTQTKRLLNLYSTGFGATAFLNSIYYTNNKERDHIYSISVSLQTFKALEDTFRKQNFKEAKLFQYYIGLFPILIEKLASFPKEIDQLKKIAKRVFVDFRIKHMFCYLISDLSICNIFNVLYIALQLNINIPNPINQKFRKRFDISKYNISKARSYWSSLQVSITIYSSAKNSALISSIVEMFLLLFQKNQLQQLKEVLQIMFVALKSPNRIAFSPIINNILEFSKQFQFNQFIELYIMSRHKCLFLNQWVIELALQRQQNFTIFLFLMSSLQPNSFKTNQGTLLPVLRTVIERQSTRLTINHLKQFNIVEIHSLLSFYSNFHEQISFQTNKILQMLVHIVSSEYQRVVDYFEPHIALDFVQLCLQLLKKLNIQMATLHVQRLRRIVQLVQSSSVTKLVRLKIIMINCSYWMQEYDRPELKELVMEEILEELQRQNYDYKQAKQMLLLFKMHLLELIDVRPNKAIKLSFAINSSIQMYYLTISDAILILNDLRIKPFNVDSQSASLMAQLLVQLTRKETSKQLFRHMIDFLQLLSIFNLKVQEETIAKRIIAEKLSLDEIWQFVHTLLNTKKQILFSRVLQQILLQFNRLINSPQYADEKLFHLFLFIQKTMKLSDESKLILNQLEKASVAFFTSVLTTPLAASSGVIRTCFYYVWVCIKRNQISQECLNMLNFIVSSKHNKTIEIDQRLISPQIQELIWNYALKVLHKQRFNQKTGQNNTKRQTQQKIRNKQTKANEKKESQQKPLFSSNKKTLLNTSLKQQSAFQAVLMLQKKFQSVNSVENYFRSRNIHSPFDDNSKSKGVFSLNFRKNGVLLQYYVKLKDQTEKGFIVITKKHRQPNSKELNAESQLEKNILSQLTDVIVAFIDQTDPFF